MTWTAFAILAMFYRMFDFWQNVKTVWLLFTCLRLAWRPIVFRIHWLHCNLLQASSDPHQKYWQSFWKDSCHCGEKRYNQIPACQSPKHKYTRIKYKVLRIWPYSGAYLSAKYGVSLKRASKIKVRCVNIKSRTPHCYCNVAITNVLAKGQKINI